MEAIISVDPGSSSGWSVLSIDINPKLIMYGIVNFSKRKGSIDSYIKKIVLECNKKKIFIRSAIIEDQYLNKNVKSTISLARNSGRWQEALLNSEIESSFIQASVWQSKTIKLQNRIQLKKSSVLISKSLWNVELPVDVSDSALMGRFYAITEHLKRKFTYKQ